MTNATMFHEEITSTVQDRLGVLTEMINQASSVGEGVRLTFKRDAMQKLWDSQGERLTHVQNQQDLHYIKEFIRNDAVRMNLDVAGVNLFLGYINSIQFMLPQK